MTPENAHRFKQFKKVSKALEQLELDDRAMIVAAFDIGRQIVIASPYDERFEAESDNPFRWESK